MLEEVHQFGQVLRIYRLTLLPVHSINFLLAIKEMISQLFDPVSCFPETLIIMDCFVIRLSNIFLVLNALIMPFLLRLHETSAEVATKRLML